METLWRHRMAPLLQVFPCLEDHPSGQSYRPPFTTPTPPISPVSDVTFVQDLRYYRKHFDVTWPMKVNVVLCLSLQACAISFRVCKSVHHRTFKQINQPDASISQIYCLSFKYSSTFNFITNLMHLFN